MRLAYERYSGPRGFTDSEFRKTMAEVAGVNLDEFFARAVDSTEELDYTEALDWFGLRFRKSEPPRTEGHDRAYLGIGTRTDDGRILVSQVVRGTPAWNAGLNAGDEIVAMERVPRAGPGSSRSGSRCTAPVTGSRCSLRGGSGWCASRLRLARRRAGAGWSKRTRTPPPTRRRTCGRGSGRSKRAPALGHEAGEPLRDALAAPAVVVVQVDDEAVEEQALAAAGRAPPD